MYSVPVIPPDLRHEETIIQAANALDCLQNTINSVFEKIDNRILRNSKKVNELSERISKAQIKINSLVGTKKAIKIYAPARFPANNVFQDIPVTFAHDTAVSAAEQFESKYDIKSRVDPLSAQALKEKLQFFHVRTEHSEAMSQPLSTVTKDANQKIGKGAVPEELRSVSSVLLFNTDEHVYGCDTLDIDLNSWKRAKLFKNQSQNKTTTAPKQLIEPAPHSLANRNQKQTPSGGLRYTPKLHEAPEINLPLDLPDLPGIANDIQFEGKEQQQIAPSLFIDNLPELTELVEEARKNEDSAAISHKPNLDNIPKPTETSITELIPAPPPPPPPPPMLALSPPPPPPPPTVLTNMLNITTEQVSVSPDNRSELMDAIRKAGGARGGRLRAAAAAPVDVIDSRANTTKTKTAGGDLMADLHNKLLMRRKGISGAKENENEKSTTIAMHSSNPVISRLSALIPPPTIRKNTSDDEEEEDSNDTDWAD